MNNSYLIIDDDEVFSSVLSRSIHRQGYESMTANNGEDALSLVENHCETLTHVVLDLNLQHSSGLELLPDLLALKPSLKIIILTGYSSIATAVEAVKRGAVNYLCKPANLHDILNAFDEKNTGSLEMEVPSVERLEWEHIQKVLNENSGNISATARALGMHRRTLQRKLQKKPVNQ